MSFEFDIGPWTFVLGSLYILVYCVIRSTHIMSLEKRDWYQWDAERMASERMTGEKIVDEHIKHGEKHGS